MSIVIAAFTWRKKSKKKVSSSDANVTFSHRFRFFFSSCFDTLRASVAVLDSAFPFSNEITFITGKNFQLSDTERESTTK